MMVSRPTQRAGLRPAAERQDRQPDTGQSSLAHYTIIMDWDGGTYLYQAQGQDVHRAVCRCIEELDLGPIPGMGPAARTRLAADVRKQEPVAITGLTNVWCYSASVRGELAILHVVRTDETTRE